MLDRYLRVFLYLLLALLAGNLIFLDFVWFKEKPARSALTTNNETTQSAEEPVNVTLTPTAASTCGPDCQKLIEDSVQKAVAGLPLPSTPTVVKATPTPNSGVAVSYLPVGGSFSSSATSWTDVGGTEFYFNQSDYPRLKTLRWEASLKADLGGNNVSVRLYDVTNSRAVDNSELVTSSATSVLVRSADLTIWQGNNLYRIQAKSSTGTLLFIDAPRLKITTGS